MMWTFFAWRSRLNTHTQITCNCQWCRGVLSDHTDLEIKSFKSSFGDGRVLCALCAALEPTCLDFESQVDAEVCGGGFFLGGGGLGIVFGLLLFATLLIYLHWLNNSPAAFATHYEFVSIGLNNFPSALANFCDAPGAGRQPQLGL